MSRMFVTVSALISISESAKRTATTLREQIGLVDDHVTSLESSFEGETAEAYSEQIDKWVTEALGLIDAIDGLAQFLRAAAEAVQQVDSELAAALTADGSAGGGQSDQIAVDSIWLQGLSTRINGIAEELRRAGQMFSGAGFNSGEIESALTDFREDWSKAREGMITSLDAARGIADASAEAFQQTESELTRALSG